MVTETKGERGKVNGPLATYGTFGPMLRTVQEAPALPGDVTWSRWEQNAGGRRAVIIRFRQGRMLFSRTCLARYVACSAIFLEFSKPATANVNHTYLESAARNVPVSLPSRENLRVTG